MPSMEPHLVFQCKIYRFYKDAKWLTNTRIHYNSIIIILSIHPCITLDVLVFFFFKYTLLNPNLSYHLSNGRLL